LGAGAGNSYGRREPRVSSRLPSPASPLSGGWRTATRPLDTEFLYSPLKLKAAPVRSTGTTVATLGEATVFVRRPGGVVCPSRHTLFRVAGPS